MSVDNMSVENMSHFKPSVCCGQSYKHFTLVNYYSRVVIWGNFKTGMYNSRVIINERKMFIRLATGQISLEI